MPKLSRRSSGFAEHGCERRTPDVGRVVDVGRRLRRHDRVQDRDPGEREDAGEHEDPRHADGAVQRRRRATSESANTSPIEAPIIAIVLVRCSSRVRSAANAITAAEIAPAPWITRPAIVTQMSCAPAATKLPARTEEPEEDHALAAVAVGRHAEWDLQHRLRKAVRAECDADEHQVVARRGAWGHAPRTPAGS